jgi:hypothetical protein
VRKNTVGVGVSEIAASCMQVREGGAHSMAIVIEQTLDSAVHVSNVICDLIL